MFSGMCIMLGAVFNRVYTAQVSNRVAEESETDGDTTEEEDEEDEMTLG